MWIIDTSCVHIHMYIDKEKEMRYVFGCEFKKYVFIFAYILIVSICMQ